MNAVIKQYPIFPTKAQVIYNNDIIIIISSYIIIIIFFITILTILINQSINQSINHLYTHSLHRGNDVYISPQIIMSKFLSLDNQDESKEKNKDLILSTLRKLGDTNAISLPNQSRLTVMDTTSRSDTIVDGVVAPVPLTAGSLNTVSTVAQTSA